MKLLASAEFCLQVSKYTWCLTSTETIRFIRHVEKGGMGYGGGGRKRLYTYRYTVTTRMTYALRWAAVRAIIMFHNCEGQSHKTVSTDHDFSRSQRRCAVGPENVLVASASVHLRARNLYRLRQ